LSEKGNAFLRSLKKKGFKEAKVTRMRLDNLSTSTTPESNKSLDHYTQASTRKTKKRGKQEDHAQVAITISA
jgi:hypothetical protein